MPFGVRLTERVARVGNAACVGLDPFLDRIPGLRADADPEEAAVRVRDFCLAVVEAVAPIVAAVKPQTAFFEVLGAPGWAALAQVVREARRAGLIVVLDAKRGDIGSTAEAYARALLDPAGLDADALTVSPYLGPESLTPFLARSAAGKGVFVLVRTSNPGAEAWQVETGTAARVAAFVAECCPGPALGDVGAVVAATLPAGEAAAWRAAMPNSWLLVPGFGAQGAGPAEVRAHFRADGKGALVTSSREVLFPKAGTDPGDVRTAVAARARRFVEALSHR